MLILNLDWLARRITSFKANHSGDALQLAHVQNSALGLTLVPLDWMEIGCKCRRYSPIDWKVFIGTLWLLIFSCSACVEPKNADEIPRNRLGERGQPREMERRLGKGVRQVRTRPECSVAARQCTVTVLCDQALPGDSHSVEINPVEKLQ